MENEKKAPLKIMVIVWKWRGLVHVNADSFKEAVFDEYNTDITLGMMPTEEELNPFTPSIKHFFKEFPVEYSAQCPNAMVVGAAIYNEKDQKKEKYKRPKELLLKLLEQYAKGDNQVMVFLHRSNFYDEEHVTEILSKFPNHISKCFLFADGRDYIYYQTQKSGLLNGAGGFVKQAEPNGIRIATYLDGQVKQPYFDRVWQYYENEFETKVLLFKESLFDCWFPLLLKNMGDGISSKQLIQVLENQPNDVLFYRLKSFLGMYAVLGHDDLDFEQEQALKKELKAIEEAEKTQGLSLIFDDCIVNLEHETLVSEVYHEARKFLMDVLFAPEEILVSNAQLHKIANQFNYLIKVIPGGIA
jgi:hypothetical protein